MMAGAIAGGVTALIGIIVGIILIVIKQQKNAKIQAQFGLDPKQVKQEGNGNTTGTTS